MKAKIGTGTCLDCGYKDCDIGLDRNGHPYLVCWSDSCQGEQYFTKGKPAKVARLLTVYRPIAGKPSAETLRQKYNIVAAAPIDDDNGTRADPTPAPAPKARKSSGVLIPD